MPAENKTTPAVLPVDRSTVRARHISELPADLAKAMLEARMGPEHDHLNALMEGETMPQQTTEPDEFYIVDLRPEWQRPKRFPYVTVWRPDDCGYAYPLVWAGIYSKERVDAHPGYYANAKGTGTLMNFPVPRAVVEALAIPEPRPGIVDGNVGPVLPNTPEVRHALRRACYRPRKVLANAE